MISTQIRPHRDYRTRYDRRDSSYRLTLGGWTTDSRKDPHREKWYRTHGLAPGALDTVEKLRQIIQQLQGQLVQQTAAQGATTTTINTTNSIDMNDMEVPLQGHGARTGTYLYGDLWPTGPKLDAPQAKYRMWQEQMVSVRCKWTVKLR